MSYSQKFVGEIVERHSVAVKIDNSQESAKPLLARFHHVWTPDLHVLADDGAGLYHWNGYLPPAEFAARLLVAFGQARLRLRQFDAADALFSDALTRFPTAFAAPEAQYFLGVTRYRKSGEGKDLLQGWHDLEKTYPGTEWAAKQNFD